MSVTYGVIAIVLGAMGASNRRGDLLGRPGTSPTDKMFGVFNSLGNIAFAFSAAIITIEVEHTLREPPRAAVSMRKSISASMTTAFTLYALVSVLGYAALGPDAPDDVLVGFEKVNFAPLWLAMLANAAVLVHMIAAVQTYMQPIFEWIEDLTAHALPQARRQGAAVFVPPARPHAHHGPRDRCGRLFACLRGHYWACWGNYVFSDGRVLSA